MEEWHKKLGHINHESVKKLTKMSTGMPDLTKCENEFLRWSQTNKVSFQPGGQIEPKTHDGRSYFLTCIDDYTHFCKVYLLKTKDKANQYLKEYINEGEAYFNLKAHKIRCDNC